MTSTLILLVVLSLVVLLWLDGARARELAVGIGKHACRQRGLQFLDDTVFMQRIGLRWTKQGLRFRRMFSFEYSVEGVIRHTAYILLIGADLESVHIQGRDTVEHEGVQDHTGGTTDSRSDNVIPFRDKDH